MIEIYLLEQLAAVAEHGTLLKAAQALYLSQPALSRSMKKLETQLGVSLFDRDNSRIALNKTGLHAVEYAKRILELDREMCEGVADFDRRQRTVSVGACAPFPLGELTPVIQERYIQMAVTTELADDERLLSGLRNRVYQLAILHEKPEDKDLFCQHYLEEKLFIVLPPDHQLAERQFVTFDDLRGNKVLLGAAIGFWMDICRRRLNTEDLLIQNSMEALYDLIEASTLPHFTSDRIMERGFSSPDRVTIPLEDPDAKTTYYIACLNSEKKKYGAVFSAAREAVLRNR